MLLRSHDFFSKSHIDNPRKWWQKTKYYFKKFEDKIYPCEDHENPQEITMFTEHNYFLAILMSFSYIDNFQFSSFNTYLICL